MATSSFRSGSSSTLFESTDRFPDTLAERTSEMEEAQILWAAIESLPTHKRVRKSILNNVINTAAGCTHTPSNLQQVDVTNIPPETRKQLVQRLVGVTNQDNEHFLHKLQQRLQRVGITLPEIEIRFERLSASANVYVGSRALPTLINWTTNIVQDHLETFRLRKTRKKTLTILQNVSGIIKPGRMTLLLGPPASGKTTLLLALAGKFDKTLKVEGEVKYNGHTMNEFVPQRTSTYISQHDVHMWEMTVRETFDFSSRCQGVGSRSDVLSELCRREKQLGVKPDFDIDVFMKAIAIEGQKSGIMTDYVLKALVLEACADTIVGDHMHRGISGGQKKRVTTGEMIVGGDYKVFLLDEVSTGLDSSTTYEIIRCFYHFVHIMRTTMVVSLLQPSPETFQLFDDVILLSEGYMVYQGSREFVLDFFETMGFKCPDKKAVADFLQEVISRKDQEQYWCTNRGQAYRNVSAEDFAEAFKSFHVGADLISELSIPCDKTKCHPAAFSKKKYCLSKTGLFKACFDRQFLLMKRNAFIHIFKFLQITSVAIIAMTVYFRTNMHHRILEDGSLYFGALFLGLVMIMFNGLSTIATTIEKLPVFYKQRDLMFYPAWAYSLPICITEIPLSVIESTAWVSLTYYTIDLAPGTNRVIRHFFLLVALHQTGLALFRLIAAVARNIIIAYTVGAFALLITFVLGGFVISREDIKWWWIWGYWLSPLWYAQNGVAVNEFLATRWKKSNEQVGVKLLESRGLFTESYWYWVSLGALVGFSVTLNILFTLALQYLNPPGKPQAIVPEDVIEENEEREMQTFPLKISNWFTPRHEIPTPEPTVKTKGMILPFQPLALTFQDINYYVDMPAEMKKERVKDQRLQLLRGASGCFRTGVLTALVGESGAGKTTLMDVLAGRKTAGYVEGSITISGHPKKQQTFARISGYCEQTDIHSPFITVYESLVYSSWLRLGDEVNSETREMFVKEVMDLVELNELSIAMVGFPGVNGLSIEQRKRLTIAVELVSNPSIIFMDEPTSGLDARAAAIVMRTIRNTVNTGRTVVCTIHQPGIDIFDAFDELLLMKRGGQIIYAGSLGRHSQTLIDYFEAIEGVPKISPGINPATWMLEVTSVRAETRLGVDFAEIYRSSSLYQRNKDLVQELSHPLPGSKDLYFQKQFGQPFAVQTMACLWKQHWSYWRNPQYNTVRLIFTLFCALIFGTIFWRIGQKMHRKQDILNALGSMFAATIFLGFSNAVSVQPVVDVERTVFYRERAAGMYSALPFAIAQLLIEVPYVFVQTLVYGVIVYSLTGLTWTAAKFFWYLFFMFFTFLYTTYYGMIMVGFTPNADTATVLTSAFIAVWMTFSGFIVPRPRIPVWWRWYYWACPFAWTLYGLAASQFGDISDEVVIVDGEKQEVTKFLRSYFGYKHDFLGAVAVAIMTIALLFGMIFALSIRIINFQKR